MAAKRGAQTALVKRIVKTLYRDRSVTVYTPQPRVVKNAISRFKQEHGLGGSLVFETAGAKEVKGHLEYELIVELIA